MAYDEDRVSINCEDVENRESDRVTFQAVQEYTDLKSSK